MGMKITIETLARDTRNVLEIFERQRHFNGRIEQRFKLGQVLLTSALPRLQFIKIIMPLSEQQARDQATFKVAPHLWQVAQGVLDLEHRLNTFHQLPPLLHCPLHIHHRFENDRLHNLPTQQLGKFCLQRAARELDHFLPTVLTDGHAQGLVGREDHTH
ncbi:hypothetical protein D3C71_1421380 [compost metagenome]